MNSVPSIPAFQRALKKKIMLEPMVERRLREQKYFPRNLQ